LVWVQASQYVGVATVGGSMGSLVGCIGNSMGVVVECKLVWAGCRYL
jgi:hypothetical protein